MQTIYHHNLIAAIPIGGRDGFPQVVSLKLQMKAKDQNGWHPSLPAMIQPHAVESTSVPTTRLASSGGVSNAFGETRILSIPVGIAGLMDVVRSAVEFAYLIRCAMGYL